MLYDPECDHGWPPDECQACYSSFRRWLATVAERFRPGPGLEYTALGTERSAATWTEPLLDNPSPPNPREAQTWDEWQQRAADVIEHKRRTRT